MRAPILLLDTAKVFFDISKNLRNRANALNNQGDTQKSEYLLRSGKQLCCAVCLNPITTYENAVVIDGQHSHAKLNPAGKTFEFNCFNQANGCKLAGEFSSEFSWFGGFDWCYALCRTCRCQLGWHFTGEHSFFALIREQLVDCKSQT